MKTKTKFQVEIEEFERDFAAYRDSRMVLYGTGRMTATIAMEVNGFNIIGLCGLS